ncbi:Lipase, class 3 [Corchorus capsularis]|uniref:Phospholipase A1 n=1 Tax=Corchorus capsularis TaxID=210143 RepID=A0A1R3I147_COCAP|nr:Lipase, class 3 [Corchorus capsularis]
MAGSIASRWEELSGKNNWDNLLNPLDLDLRRYLIHYIERADTFRFIFNEDKEAPGYALSRYPPEGLFPANGLEVGNPFKYRVTKFIYAVANGTLSEWIGYVAVATDEGKAVLGRRDILVSWRGTMTDEDVEEDKHFKTTSAEELFGPDEAAKVHTGFLSVYTTKLDDKPYSKTSAREQVLKAIQEQVDQYQNEEAVSITVTGHSLGGALATLNAMDIVYNGHNKPSGNSDKSFMVTAFPVASPHVGDNNLEQLFDRLNKDLDLHILRIENAYDLVPIVLAFTNYGYTHVGQVLSIDASKSEELDFDIALVNKRGDFLLEDMNIPTAWGNYTDFKGMAQMDDGHWKYVADYVPPTP